MHDPEWRAGSSIEVWVAPLDVPSSGVDQVTASLDDGERERATRFRFPGDARRFSLARGWLREVLGSVCGCSPASLSFVTGPNGKPALRGPSGPHFNLSHAGAVALIAVSGRPVGVDVEPLSNGHRWAEVAATACTASESAALGRLPAGQRGPAFLRLWTAKEAYLKGVGSGLTTPPDQLELGLCEPGALHPAGPGWHVLSMEPAPGYSGAVAAEGDRWSVRLRSVDEVAGGFGGVVRRNPTTVAAFAGAGDFQGRHPHWASRP